MGDKVERDLCDERSGNIQNSLKNIEKQLDGIWGRLNEDSQAIAYKRGKCSAGEMSTKKLVFLMSSISIIVQGIAQIVIAVWR